MGDARRPPGLSRLDESSTHTFADPVKKINDHVDLPFFLTSKAYTNIMMWLLQLNASMFPRKPPNGDSGTVSTWQLGAVDIEPYADVKRLAAMLEKLQKFTDEVPPDPGPRRFGNVSFRKWCQLVEERADALLLEHVPKLPLVKEGEDAARSEVKAYLLGGFGSAQRLDYGTGHELSFLAFLGGLWKSGCFAKDQGHADGAQERAIVVGVIQPYLDLVRHLIKTYTLEPAGTHGVWGLDDHSFVPYIFGSAQLAPAIATVADIPREGSLEQAPDPGDVTKTKVVEEQRMTNMYFSAIGFIYDVKKGPFWEHSPMLYDISGIRAGWAKINGGMIKMYNAEVLSKFPVVQHFPFGSLFPWETDPSAPPPPANAHSSSSVSSSRTVNPGGSGRTGTGRHPAPPIKPSTVAESQTGIPSTRAPWASSGAAAAGAATPRPAPPPGGMAPTRAPWAKD